VTRPAVGVITHCPEEPYVNDTSTVLWELGAGNRPWLPEPGLRLHSAGRVRGRMWVQLLGLLETFLALQGADWSVQRRAAMFFNEPTADSSVYWGHSHSTPVAVSQDNEFNQEPGLEDHWTDVPAAEGSLLTA